MILNAYVLAADPAWLEPCIRSWYSIVDTLVVSYDEDQRGWTGAPIPVDEVLRRVRAIDTDKKIIFAPGKFSRPGKSAMESDTLQRQAALNLAAAGRGRRADWVLQLDTDEFLPRPQAVLDMLVEAERRDIPAVEWPMRVLFRTLSEHRFLEVCARTGQDRFEYPGPIAVRPDAPLKDARRTSTKFLRPVVAGDAVSLQIARPEEEGEVRIPLADAESAILHFSWARPPRDVKAKIASWGHNEGLKSWLFYYLRWKPAPLLWRFTRDFHPFARGLWPALKLRETSIASNN